MSYSPSLAFDEIDIDTSYEPFSREPEYIEANRLLIEQLPLQSVQGVLDLACGTGTMTELLLKRCLAENRGQLPQVVGVDLSRESLLWGQADLTEMGFFQPLTPHQSGSVILVEGTADCLPIATHSIDLAMMGNAIHMVANREALFSEIARVLRPGGYFAFNTSFYAGTYVPGTEPIYRRWVQEAIAYLQRRNAELKAAGLPGIVRQRGQGAPAFSTHWLSTLEYTQEMAAHNLNVQWQNERTVMLTQRSFETIGSYAGLGKVLLSGYPVKLACEALFYAAAPTLAAEGLTEVPRYWLEMVAQKSRD
ncbi:MAG: class I SAM-dependent methyltransferase [Desertifilum sp.]|nr:class I SAM-dependent methyltransferase [Desertifilum sp.]